MNYKVPRLLCALLSCASLTLQANVVINTTRIIYPAEAREVTAILDNPGKQPALIQTWIDDGDSNASPEKIQVPFVLLPPMFRLDPGQQQNLRITFTHSQALPQDRESIFWLNMLDIPPKPRGEINNYLQFSIRSRFKLFYRPNNLSADPTKAAETLQWQLIDGGKTLQVQNPSPYHVTITKLTIGGQSQEGKMVPPFGRENLRLTKPASAPTAVEYSIVDDYGAQKQHRAQVQQ
jgi:P pilus assembly chaperone PapD